MEAFNQLLDLKQGSSPIEEYVTRFCEISCKVPFDEVALKYIFGFGLSEPIKSCLPEGKFQCRLKDFMDYALLCAGSSFTVGVAEEEHDTALTHVMTDAPEGTHKMVEATKHHQSPESHNMPTEPESAHVMPTEPGSALIVSAKPGPARIMSATPESQAKLATKPADAPLRPGLIACVLDAPLVSVRAAGIPRAAALTIPESRPVRVNLLESRHVSADNPEPPHASVPCMATMACRTTGIWPPPQNLFGKRRSAESRGCSGNTESRGRSGSADSRGRSGSAESRGRSGSADSRGRSGSAESRGRSGSAELDSASGDEGELDGTSGGKGELDGTSGGKGELDGTSGGKGELDGTSGAELASDGIPARDWRLSRHRVTVSCQVRLEESGSSTG